MDDVRTVLERAARSGLPGLRLEPGLDAAGIEHFGRRVGVPIPPAARDLLLYAAGFVYDPVGRVSFTGVDGFEFEALCPKSVALAGDGEGNFWVVDIDPQTGAWGRVLFVSHDPPVVVLQAVDMAEFTDQVLGPGQSGQRQALREEAHVAAGRVWRDEPHVIRRDQAMASADGLIVKFAASLPDSYGIVDLRAASNGAGFAWGRSGPRAEPRRCGAELVFGVDPARGRSFWSRLLGGTRGR